jgi:inhibitor of cysteine peptidase
MLYLLAILLLILSSCLGVQPGVSSPPSGGSSDGDVGTGMFKSYTVIENVDVLILESFPMQLHLQVTGHQPDGCEVPVTIEQRREGNEVFVDVYREMSAAMACPAMVIPYEGKIALEGGFESGTYTIHVNDFVKEITI